MVKAKANDPYAPGGRLHWIAESAGRQTVSPSYTRATKPRSVADVKPVAAKAGTRKPRRSTLPGLSPRDAAKLAGVTEHTIVRACRIGEIRHTVYTGKAQRTRIEEPDLRAWMDRPETLTPRVAAAMVGASLNTVKLWIKRGGLPFTRRGELIRLDKAVFLEWFKAHRPNFGKSSDLFRPRLKSCHPAKGGVIYALYDPRPEYAKCPIRYIGQAKDYAARAKFYRCDFNKGRAHSRCLRNWFRKLKRLGLAFEMRQVDARLFGIGELEREWIAKGRAAGWDLLNVTDGGDETEMTAEARQRLAHKARLAWQRPEYKERWRASMARVWAARKASRHGAAQVA